MCLDTICQSVLARAVLETRVIRMNANAILNVLEGGPNERKENVAQTVSLTLAIGFKEIGGYNVDIVLSHI